MTKLLSSGQTGWASRALVESVFEFAEVCIPQGRLNLCAHVSECASAVEIGVESAAEKANGRDKRGSTSRPSIFVVTVLTPATTETEDSPAVSSCPTIYIATRVPCKALFVEEYEDMNFLFVLSRTFVATAKSVRLLDKNNVIISKSGVKFST